MRFASALWLAALIPFSAGVVWLLLRRDSAPTHVPFVQLWRESASSSRSTRRTVRRPPAWLVVALLGCLLAIVAAGRPFVERRVAENSVPKLQIERAALRDWPTTQVMVRLQNPTGAEQHATLQIEGADPVPVVLGRGASANYFVDLSADSSKREVSIRIVQDSSVIDRATIEPATTRWQIEMRGALPAEVRRVISAYEASHRSGNESDPKLVVATDLNPGQPGVLVVTADAVPAMRGAIDVANHEINRDVGWPNAIDDLRLPEAPLERVWIPIVESAGRPLVAVREGQVRQVKVSFASTTFAQDVRFVVLWTNILDWVQRVGRPEFPATRASQSESKIHAPPRTIDLTGPAVLGALVLLLVSAALQRRAQSRGAAMRGEVR